MGIYISDAVMEYEKDPTHERWHQFHQNRRKEYVSQYNGAELAQISGQLGPIEKSLSSMLAAMKFTSAHSRNPKRTSCGWYDDQFLLSEDSSVCVCYPFRTNNFSTLANSL